MNERKDVLKWNRIQLRKAETSWKPVPWGYAHSVSLGGGKKDPQQTPKITFFFFLRLKWDTLHQTQAFISDSIFQNRTIFGCYGFDLFIYIYKSDSRKDFGGWFWSLKEVYLRTFSTAQIKEINLWLFVRSGINLLLHLFFTGHLISLSSFIDSCSSEITLFTIVPIYFIIWSKKNIFKIYYYLDICSYL